MESAPQASEATHQPCLLLTDSSRPKSRAAWKPNLDEILKAGALGGPAKLQRSIERILRLNPYLSGRQIFKRTAELRLTNWNRPWSPKEKEYVLGYARELSVVDIARNLGRTPAAVYQLLSRNGESAKVQDGYTQGDLAQIFHVSPRKVRHWISLGWLTLYQRRIKDRALDRFLKEHGEEIDASRIDREFRLWFHDVGLRERATHSREWSSSRQQSLKEHVCGQCGRKVRGNAIYRHSKACIKRLRTPSSLVRERTLN